MTRPLPQGLRFVRHLRQQTPIKWQVTHSPLMNPVFLQPLLPDKPWGAVIFTSETGVAAAKALGALPKTAFCVGDQTARAARRAGFAAVSANGDAAALLALIRAAAPPVPLLHICGQHTRGDVAETLTSAGTETVSCIAYRQEPVALSVTAHRLLAGHQPLILPLFSPRTARLFCQQVAMIVKAPLFVAAISPAVAAAMADLPAAQLAVASEPTSDAMVKAVGILAEYFPVA